MLEGSGVSMIECGTLRVNYDRSKARISIRISLSRCIELSLTDLLEILDRGEEGCTIEHRQHRQGDRLPRTIRMTRMRLPFHTEQVPPRPYCVLPILSPTYSHPAR